MKMKIVADSACDVNKDLKERLNLELVPLTIQIDEKRYKDDKNINIKELIQHMKKSKDYPRTSCPSPNDFIEAFKGDEDEDVFAVTMSSGISGTYNSAVLAKNMVLEEMGNKFIHVFDTLSASVGETLVSMKILETAKENYEKLQIVEKVSEYIKDMKTFFVLENLDNLVKSGRLNALKGKVASLLSIKPILMASDDGVIEKLENVRGTKKAMRRLVDIIGEYGGKFEEKVLGIGHCSCLEKAKKLKEEALKRYNFKEIVIVEMAGITSVYANEDGIVICF
ncbi:DegV family protein [Sporosalibacterium faouarense]|uniref:DegV family protein n=1 Tax=Sporosalibacterium faouarense TaxID=516123 RepID=UPI00141D6568|nr:DegV family protein [Sporosalibacterium faouarense]MTI49591.1 DegV family protein [Bacillota bacterium]